MRATIASGRSCAALAKTATPTMNDASTKKTTHRFHPPAAGGAGAGSATGGRVDAAVVPAEGPAALGGSQIGVEREARAPGIGPGARAIPPAGSE